MTPRAVLVAGLLCLWLAPAVAQGAQPWVGLSLPEALERLRAEGLNIIYSEELVRPDLRVTAEPNAGASLIEIAQQLLVPHGLLAQEAPGGAVVVIAGPRSPPPAGAIRGRVRAADTSQPLRAVEVSLVAGDRRVRTGRDGGFVLAQLGAGSYSLRVTYPGYVELQLDEVVVKSGRTTPLDLELVPRPRFLQEVVVTPSRYHLLNNQHGSRQFLDRREVRQLPHISDDLLRVVHRLPGTVAGDISATFGIRGGAPDEVMIVLDGLQILQPFHLRDVQSMFSIIDAEAVAGVELLTGGFPVEYGDRMSGVVQATSAIPVTRRRSIGASFVTARALAEGLSAGGRGAWLVSVRRGYLDWIVDWIARITDDTTPRSMPSYYDLFASLRHPLDNDTLLKAHLLASYDRITFLDDDRDDDVHGHDSSWYVWGNLFKTWPSGLSAETILSLSQGSRALKGFSKNIGESYTEVDDSRGFTVLGLKQDWIVESSQRHLLKFGTEVRHARADYDHHSSTIIFDPLYIGDEVPTPTEIHADVTPSGWQLGLYVADRFRLARGVTAEVGLRWDRQDWTPGNDQISPRLNAVWDMGSHGTLRAAWGEFAQSQAIHELQVEDGLTRFYPAQWAEHRVISFERTMPSGVRLRLEAYRKRMSDLRPRFENLFEPLEILPAGEADRVRIDAQRAEAQGLELTLKGDPKGRWSWWFGFALATAKDRIDGDWQPRSWDQRHALSFSVNRRTKRGWNVNLAGVYHSGWPTTPVYGSLVQQPGGSWVIQTRFGERNSKRFPAYLRLDMRAGRTFKLRRGTLRLFFEVYNLLNNRNIRSTGEIWFEQGPNTILETRYEYEEWIPMLPSFGLSWEF